jgi:hypothetical protein
MTETRRDISRQLRQTKLRARMIRTTEKFLESRLIWRSRLCLYRPSRSQSSASRDRIAPDSAIGV